MIRSVPARAVAALALAGVLALASCTAPAATPAAPSSSAPPSTPASVAPQSDAPPRWRVTGTPDILATGLLAPWSVVPLASGGALISERGNGTVLELTRAGDLRVAGVVPDVVSGGESGLHGLAVHEAAGERWLYAYHGSSDDNRVVRMPLTGEDGSLGFGAPQTVLDGLARAGNHNGGRIAFGPDGFLYVATGDAGDPDRSQDLASLNGKILRVTADGDPAPGNPFDSAVYSLGHRNIQGLAWTTDGTLWATEFGQNTWDEVNAIQAGGNYGWPVAEGIAEDERFIDPAVVWSPVDASPSGMAAVGDTLFVAALRGERLWTIDTADGAAAGEASAVFTGEWGRLRDVVAAPDGGLWVLTNNTDGRGTAQLDDDRLLDVAVDTAE